MPLWINDWRRCWRLTPMRILALGGTVQGAVVTCPAAISDHLPPWVLQVASTFSFACMIAAGLGIGKRTRLEVEEKQDEARKFPPVNSN